MRTAIFYCNENPEVKVKISTVGSFSATAIN